MNELFDDNFSEINTDEELEKLKKDNSQYDEYYVTTAVSPERRVFFEKLWEKYRPYADKHFKKYKKEFHAKTWEMYLGNIFLDNNIKFKTLNHGPDFCILQDDFTRFWIEAVIADFGTGKDAVPQPKISTINNTIIQDVPEEQIILRMTSVISDKQTQYKKYIEKNIINKDKPFCIAVNTGIISWTQRPIIPLMAKCLYGVGYLCLPQKGSDKKPFWLFRPSVNKISGEVISTKIFSETENNNLSAVLWSDKTILNHCLYPNSKIIVFHNPFAQNPLDKSLLPGMIHAQLSKNRKLEYFNFKGNKLNEVI